MSEIIEKSYKCEPIYIKSNQADREILVDISPKSLMDLIKDIEDEGEAYEYIDESKLDSERAARLEAEKKVKVLEPKGEFYDDVAGSKDSIEMGHVAKVLGIRGIGRNNLFALLRDKKVLDRNNIPYQQYVDCGYFRVLEQKYTVPNGETKINIKTMVFQKGIDFIRKKIKEP
nr:phage antirepressor KilAC domain-containing protein [Clostridium beijerinckii]